MDSSFSVSSRGTYDIPKTETGLAEWTSKIKALQRQVDEDEEDEQKRLEEEIATARLARLRRRSRGGGSRADSVDLSNSREQLGLLDKTNDTSANDTSKPISERQQDQDSTLRKLMSRNDVYNPDKVGRPDAGRVDPVSLASFMGGRATGPRLNRHAPQQDAHDPSQFIQPDVSAPHPIFGRGGIAMPGMASKTDSKSLGPIAGSEHSERYQPSFSTPKSTLSTTMSPDVIAVNEMTKSETKEVHRRSFTSTPKSPSPALAARYTEKVDSPIRDTKSTSEPLLATRRSFSSIPKSTSPLPSSIKQEPAPIVSPTKLADTFRSPSIAPSWSKPVPSYSTASTPRSTSSVPVNRVNSSNTSTNVVDTPLHRIMERNNVYNPDKDPRKTVAERVQTTSLAAFMGAPGKGIRLNRHAPQQDVHDPTQFIQPDLSAPHPIFGKGGIAMPGMVSKKTHTPQDSTTGVDKSEGYRPSTVKKATRPPASPTERTQDRALSPQKTGNRERTMSTPRAESPASSGPQSSSGWSRATTRAASPAKENRSMTPVRDRTISVPSYSRISNSTQEASRPSVSPSVGASYLARPIQPEPKASSLSPHIPVTVASPAFQRPAAQKDLTPSLSRLQGRGFVQNVVKASSQLGEMPPSPTPGSADRSRPSSASGKKGSVLDRWQPNAQASSPTKSLSTLPYSNAMQRSPMQNKASPSPQMADSSMSGSSHALKSVASLPSLAKSASSPQSRAEQIEDPYPRSKTPGLGSSTTMVVIKPSKSFTDLKQRSHADELGMKPSGQNDKAGSSHRDPSPSSRKPFIHPAEDRAHKPEKNHDDHLLAEDDNHPLAKSPIQERSLPGYEELQPISTKSDETPFVKETSSPFTEICTPESKDITQVEEDNQKSSQVDLVPSFSPTHSSSTEYLRAKPLEIVSPNASMTKLDVPPSPSKERSHIASPPGKHYRIPSTGNRLTVMEVAQALTDHPEPDNKTESYKVEPSLPPDLPSPVESIARPRSMTSLSQAEKRKSNYEKYSAIILPPLKEEATPVPSPAGTLDRRHAPPFDAPLNGSHIKERLATLATEEEESLVKVANTVDLNNHNSLVQLNVRVADLLTSRPRPPKQPADIQTISVEVLSIVANAATTVSQCPDIFYDTEILAIIHRVKSKSSGLASTSVWCWLGKQTRLGDREEKKLNEVAKRYGTTAKFIQQLAEPAELVQVLGGRLAIRQGTRAHWTPENTTMHLVRALNSVLLIDEYDLDVKNLCSAFSYCFTLLGSIYVWHGCGSSAKERKGALDYAQTLSPDTVSPIELIEGEDDNDEMFWMMLGDDEFAQADYWKWRHTSLEIDPLIWRIESENVNKPVIPVEFISMEQGLQSSVYIINCVWELFVLVGQDARGHRQDIRCAVELAKTISLEIAFARPCKPTIHVLIIPSRLPLDLRLGIRDLNEAWLNKGEVPDHMNLLHCSEADIHLDKISWEPLALKDRDMLPLGVDASDMP